MSTKLKEQLSQSYNSYKNTCNIEIKFSHQKIPLSQNPNQIRIKIQSEINKKRKEN